jgi:ABC-2 type transport system permease protein
MKLYRRARIWVLYAILFSIVCFASTAYFNSSGDLSGGDWRAMARKQIEQDHKTLAAARSTDQAKANANRRLALNEYRLEHDIPGQGMVPSPWNTIKKSSSLTVVSTLLTIIIAAEIVAGEFIWGTIKLLLIRPHSRAKILLSKYLTVLTTAFSMLALQLLTSIGVNMLLYRFHYVTLPDLVMDANGQIHEVGMLGATLINYGYQSIEFLLLVTLAFMLSSVFRSTTLAVGLAMFVALAGQIVTALLTRYSWGKYWLFANTDLTVYRAEAAPEGMTIGFSLSVIVAYYVLFLIVSWAAFIRRDVAI